MGSLLKPITLCCPSMLPDGLFTPKDAFSWLLDLIANANRTLLSVSVPLFSLLLTLVFCVYLFCLCLFLVKLALILLCDNNTFLTSGNYDRESLQIKCVGWQTAGMYWKLGGRCSKSGLLVFLHVCLHATNSSYHSRKYLVYTEIRTSL